MKALIKYALCFVLGLTSLSAVAANKTIEDKKTINQVLAYLPKTALKIKQINASKESSGKQTASEIIVNYAVVESPTHMTSSCTVQGHIELTYDAKAGDYYSGFYFNEQLAPCPKKLISLIKP